MSDHRVLLRLLHPWFAMGRGGRRRPRARLAAASLIASGALAGALGSWGVAGAAGTGRAVDAVPVEPAPQRAEMGPNGGVRVAHQVDGLGPADVFVDGRRRMAALPTGGLGEFLVLPAGRHAVSLRGARDTASVTLDVPSGGSIVAVVAGPIARPQVQTVPLALHDPSAIAHVRVVNATAEDVAVTINAVTVHVAARGASSRLGVEEGRLSVAGAGSARTRTVRHGADVLAILGPGPAGSQLRAFDTGALAPGALAAIDVPMTSHGFAASVLVDDALWLRRVMSAAVVLLVVLATASTLAAFRSDAMEDRVRHRMQ